MIAISLDEVLQRITNKTPEQQAEIKREVEHATKNLKWLPNPGPQTQAYFSKADVLLFGGEPGGGKSQVCLGLAFNCHERSLIMRRQYGDLDRLVEDAIKINRSKDGFNGSPPPKFRISEKQTIDFAAAHRVGDEQSQMGKGHDLICVQRGTLVLMANKTYVAIENLCIGDLIMTLEGAKPVTRKLPVRRDLGVEIKIEHNGVKYSQVQSRSHSLLTNIGWVSCDKFYALPPPYSSLPKQSHIFCKTSWRFLWKLWPVCLRHARKDSGHLQSSELKMPKQGLQDRMGTFSYTSQQALGNVCAMSYASTLVKALHSLSNFLAKPFRLLHWKAGQLNSRWTLFAHDVFGEIAASLPQDLKVNYSSDSDLYGEPPRLLIHLCSESMDAQQYPHQPNDVAPQIPSYFAVDDQGKIPKHMSHKEWYAHPYTKEIRRIVEPVFESSFSMTPVEEIELHDIEVLGSNHYITLGGFINKNCFDEATHFAESQVRFVMGWLRTDTPGQRTRVVMATNPPLSAEGLWVIDMFSPWLNPQYPNPAQPGELRWVISDEDGKDRWVESNAPMLINEKLMYPVSRTYIPSKVSDNPYYAATDYERQLDAMPEPYRSLLMGGFQTAFRDAPDQIIPTKWVQLAQQRWTPKKPPDVPMCTMGVDASGGGEDPMIIAMRYDGWFATMIEVPGKEIPMERAGAHAGGIVISHRRDMALVVVDMGGGFGGPMYEHLHENAVALKAYKGAESSTRRSIDGKMQFTNKRTAAYWQFREALDPGQPGGSPISLPVDSKLLADLTAPTFTIVPRGIQAESKEKVCERLGRSTDRGDAVVMAWYEGPRMLTDAMEWIDAKARNTKRGHIPVINNGGRREPLSVRNRG